MKITLDHALDELQAGNTIVIRRNTALYESLRDQGLTVDIGRPGRWGNPHKLHNTNDDIARAKVIAAYKEYIVGQPQLMADLPMLRGRALACWCAPKPCHGDVLVELLKAGR
jgi:hypothetical protein